MNTTHVVEAWLVQRHHLMVSFNTLCAPTTFLSPNEFCDALQKFCTALVDYVSALQFEVLEIISKVDKDHHHKGERLTSALMVALLRTTNHALAFSDLYANASANSINTKTLKKELSLLGEQFAIRLDLEDQLIRIYNQATHFLEERAKKPLFS
jgi:regulator of sigma D